LLLFSKNCKIEERCLVFIYKEWDLLKLLFRLELQLKFVLWFSFVSRIAFEFISIENLSIGRFFVVLFPLGTLSSFFLQINSSSPGRLRLKFEKLVEIEFESLSLDELCI